jgi:tetratricopeptide (TPR) repeat protein
MRRYIAIATLLLVAASHAQGATASPPGPPARGAASRVLGATLKGLILANELGGPPVPNVQVTAIGGLPAASGSDGIFAVEFPAKRPAEPVQLVVRKQGYVVVNAFQLRQRLPLPEDVDKEAVTLLLSTENDREEMARRFYGWKFSEGIEQKYKTRIKELEAQKQATEAALADLRKERDQGKAAAEKFAAEVAHLNPEAASDLYQQAMSLFLAHKTEEALKLLDEKRLQSSLEAARRREAKDKNDVAEAISAYLLRAQLLTTSLRFAEADKAYQEVIVQAPNSFEAQLSYGSFNQQLNRLPQALTAFGRSLKLARQAGNLDQIAMTQGRLGAVHYLQGRPDKAREALEEALRILDDKARKDSGYLFAESMTLVNIGNLDYRENLPDQARDAYEKALKIFRIVAEKQPEIGLPYVAGTLSNLARLHLNQNRPEQARKADEEAVAIDRTLSKQNPTVYLPLLATDLNNLGVFYDNQRRLDAALKTFDEALQLEREWARQNPEASWPVLAMTLNNLGKLYRAEGRLDEASDAYVEALKIRRALAREDPQTYRNQVANTLTHLGMLYQAQKRMEDALAACEEAREISRELAKQDASHREALAFVLSNLGALYADRNQLDDARQAHEEALAIRRALAKDNPDTYLPAVAVVLSNLGIEYQRLKRLDEARRAYEEALSIYEQFAKRNAAAYDPLVQNVKLLLKGLPRRISALLPCAAGSLPPPSSKGFVVVNDIQLKVRFPLPQDAA